MTLYDRKRVSKGDQTCVEVRIKLTVSQRGPPSSIARSVQFTRSHDDRLKQAPSYHCGQQLTSFQTISQRRHFIPRTRETPYRLHTPTYEGVVQWVRRRGSITHFSTFDTAIRRSSVRSQFVYPVTTLTSSVRYRRTVESRNASTDIRPES